MAKQWDEPAGAVTPRGWLFGTDKVCEGFYLDYGPDHYRSPHQYCGTGTYVCKDCQPGNVLAVRCGGHRRESRWFVTLHSARVWIEGRAS